jgi:hypothetical protein
MSGAIVATLLTMVVVPLLYWELRRRELTAAEENTNARALARPQQPEPTASGVLA